MVYNQAHTVVKNQDKFFAAIEEHDRRLKADSISIADIARASQLIIIKQDATIHALQINSSIALEFTSDYSKKHKELFEENKFKNQWYYSPAY